jgi:hypothetical protein
VRRQRFLFLKVYADAPSVDEIGLSRD